MRKTFVVPSLVALTLLACVDETFAFGRRGGCCGCSGGSYGGGWGRGYGGCSGGGYYGGCSGGGYYGGCSGGGYYGRQSYYGASGYYSANAAGPMGVRQSFYFDPGSQQSARFTLLVPNPDAEIWFDTTATKQRGMERVFVTPALTQEGAYTIKARWKENGKTVERERRVQARAGQAQVIDLRISTPAKLPNAPEDVPTPKAPPKKTPKQGNLQTSLPTSNQPIQGKNEATMRLLKLDGEWTPIYVEMDGKKVDGKTFTNVTIKNNVVTCRHDGKTKMFRLEFGPHHMIRCTMQDGDSTLAEPTESRGTHTHHGVYVASQDYFCLSLNKGADHRFSSPVGAREDGKEPAAQPQALERWAKHGPYGSGMVLVLRRAGVNNATNP